MLTLLHIENIAVIEAADITFDRGFNVLSGETGAGKSIIIDAISAILGERTYREAIRTGADRAFVSAVFDGVPALPWFAENHVPYEPETLIQREILADGRNLCRVNGQGVSVTVLRALGRQLITIHGQHDSQQLFDEESHLRLLDAFGTDQALLAAYGEKWEAVRRCRSELERRNLDEAEKARRQEMLQHQIKELEQANLQAGEEEALEQRQRVLLNGEKLTAGINGAVSALCGDEDTQGADELVEEALGRLSAIVRYDEALSGTHDRLRELSFSLSDLCEELRDYRDGLGDPEEEIDEIGARLDLIHKLRRKYGATTADMLAYLDKARQELDDIIFADEKRLQAQKALAAAEAEARKLALELQATRQAAARTLETRIAGELGELNMPKVRFLCQFEEVPLGPNGLDGVRFLMSANVGEALKPLAKVASGGELARIMLALKNVLAQQDSVGTLIFDEVDAGVSGRAAQSVAVKLRAVARGRQVLCVTHLPQIAALADAHLLITKTVRNERTYTQVLPLDRKGRTQELARMIGGAEITETTLKSAEEMLIV